MQTHTRPAQIERLVRLIKAGSSSDSVVLVHHDASGSPLNVRRLESLPGVYVIQGPGGYGDFSHLDRYFAAVDWLDVNGVEFDWLQNLTGQDYPLRPIAEIEHNLVNSGMDGHLQYAPVFPYRTPQDAEWGAGPEYQLASPFDASMRYEYKHRVIGRPTVVRQRWLRPIMAINLVQPWVRVSLAYSSIGMRRRNTIFTDDFVCYGGSFFCALSVSCVRYVMDFARSNPEIVAFFRATLAPEEVFLQTVLVNSEKFRLVPDGKHYIDFTNSRNNHPKVLGVTDLPAMLASDAHWARKFDYCQDSEVLDILDRRVRIDL
jgi:hypothetical protein